MSAPGETSTVGTAGKDTPGGDQLSEATSTHTVVTALWPHLAYGDAVHTELAAWELHPEVMEAGVRAAGPRGRQELFLRLVWPAGHLDLAEDVRPDGLTLAWSHVTGWSLHTLDVGRLLDVDEFVAPAVLAEFALHLAEHGLSGSWEPGEDTERWEHAGVVELACVLFDEGAR
ncbi:hypothetical protein [Streptomyces sp. AK08-02]|uniref:hypothetical protein n=1 Tax=Streptomyces sp. AK08-02 TaxID=3028654 RepID=UPI0029A244CD|nr:hypothetical protein [Streptomyces sp. AK08-02]MDX3748697.1 hypothetical protein [Streptomyces sp. AK08-02]